MNSLLSITSEDGKEIVNIHEDYDKLDHLQKLKILLSVKNWIKDEYEKIANA